MRVVRVVVVVGLLGLTAGGCNRDEPDAARPRVKGELVGLFAVSPGRCGTVATGSWVRIVNPDGSLTGGPFVENRDSPCPDRTVTPLCPGAEGGLRTGDYQPFTGSPFDFAGDARDNAIVEPVTWLSVRFALASNQRDPQAKTRVPRPTVLAKGRALSGNLRAMSVAWSGQFLNVGAPKPDGSVPGLTGGPRGAFDERSGTYTLEWSSLLVGGPFNNSTIVFHLEGTFTRSA
ncbi:MAG TPA: hypothetical protein VM030_05585 [Acidimicrobiales bacterium]|nr:hypothetical protein [Acidimicrobiales bacterium]